MITKYWAYIKIGSICLVIIFLVVTTFLFFRKSKLLEQALQVVRDSFQQQIAEIERLNAEERKKKEELQKKYEEVIKELEEKYKQQSKELDDAKKARAKELVDKYNNEELTQKLKEEFGI